MSEEANPQTTPEVNVNELFQQRVAKAEALAAAGINPFGKRFDGAARKAPRPIQYTAEKKTCNKYCFL